ncbi:MAG: hypothetical protein COY42_24325, partial [Armatimonadetes bacterium CG_4_10_14_0_8_um_filter_66_14]
MPLPQRWRSSPPPCWRCSPRCRGGRRDEPRIPRSRQCSPGRRPRCLPWRRPPRRRRPPGACPTRSSPP